MTRSDFILMIALTIFLVFGIPFIAWIDQKRRLKKEEMAHFELENDLVESQRKWKERKEIQ